MVVANPSLDDTEVITHVTPAQVEFYNKEGYLKLGHVFSDSEMDALRDHVDEMIASLSGGKRPEEMDTPHFTDAWLFRYLANPRILDIVEDLMGPDIVLWSSHFIAKPGGSGKAVPWHTDGAFWQTALDPMDVLTLWLAVDPTRVETAACGLSPKPILGDVLPSTPMGLWTRGPMSSKTRSIPI